MKTAGVALFLLLVGCGDGSGDDDDTGSDGGPASDASSSVDGAASLPGLHYLEDGTARSTTTLACGLERGASSERLHLQATLDSTFFDLTVEKSPRPLTTGSYPCAMSLGGLTMPFTSAVPGTCSITITAVGSAVGERAAGRFSATLTRSGGPTKSITEGSFDSPITSLKFF